MYIKIKDNIINLDKLYFVTRWEKTLTFDLGREELDILFSSKDEAKEVLEEVYRKLSEKNLDFTS